MAMLEVHTGTVGKNKVWIGAPDCCYELIKGRYFDDDLHALVFDIETADIVCKMLRTEIRRVRANAKPKK